MDVKKLKLPADCTSKTNMYIVLRRNSSCYYGSPTLPVPYNPNSTFHFEGNSCQRNSFWYCGSPTLQVTLNPNFTFPFEGNSGEGQGITVNYRNSSNSCSFWAEKKGTKKRN